MAKISDQDVEKIAQLAKLKITESEKESYRSHLEEIVSYVEKLNELDTDDVDPTFSVQQRKQVLRPDETKPSLPREDALKNAPSQANGFFRVPKIISQDRGES
ncbi:Asp-tRNA(Asn)/Glu-tRNA(Gln) amidotransferase subunit GatC [candidate division KSB1 bacterium]|nr:Asp-tRNA(Asn)/Glu-tRNA(Gln) amidotransferase subunit GatC [candidate division KSB1 bacterium]